MSEAMQKAGMSQGQIAMLTQTTPRELIRTRKGRGGKIFSYVPHEHVTRLLNEAFGHCWSFEVEVLSAFCSQNEVTIKGRLTVPSPHGQIVKEAFGSQEFLPQMPPGDALKGAQSDALRKAASLLGIALDLYGVTANKTNVQIAVQPTPPARQIIPAPRRDRRDDPVTNFWSFVREHNIDGRVILEQNGGDFVQALQIARETIN